MLFFCLYKKSLLCSQHLTNTRPLPVPQKRPQSQEKLDLQPKLGLVELLFHAIILVLLV